MARCWPENAGFIHYGLQLCCESIGCVCFPRQKHTVQHVLAEFVLNPVKCVFGWVGARERIGDLEVAHVAHGVLW